MIMYYVYVIAQRETDRTYVGFTSDLKQRVAAHNKGCGSQYTRTGSWTLVYYEAYLDRRDAWEREKQLKCEGRAKHQLFKRIQKSLTGQK
jgi:putative endonuclease